MIKPPSDEGAERAVLSCCLKAPLDVMPVVQGKLGRLGAQAFSDGRHQSIWSAMHALYTTSGTFDLVTLNNAIHDLGEAEESGGAAYLSELMAEMPVVAMLEHYLSIVKDKAIRRLILYRLMALSKTAFEYDRGTGELLEEIEKELFAMREFGRGMESEPKLLKELLPTVISNIEAKYHSRGKPTRGLATGFNDLDRMTMGLAPGDMFVIAARPSMGKTALMMNIVENISIDQGIPAAVFSLEMGYEDLVERMLLGRAKIDLYRARDGFLGKQNLTNLMIEAEKSGRAPMLIDDTPGLTIYDLRSRARRLVMNYGIKLIAVDYLQLVKSPSKRAEFNRTWEVSEVSNGLKQLGRELGVPVIVAAQLNREADTRKGNEPQLSDLRESGSIEQDADIVGLLWRPDYYKERSAAGREEGFAEDKDGTLAVLNIAKQRKGPVGPVKLSFTKRNARFENATANLYGGDYDEDDGNKGFD